MNTLRMLALVAAILITAGLYRAMSYGQSTQQHATDSTSVHSSATIG